MVQALSATNDLLAYSLLMGTGKFILSIVERLLQQQFYNTLKWTPHDSSIAAYNICGFYRFHSSRP
jgi:hypothetical protein